MASVRFIEEAVSTVIEEMGICEEESPLENDTNESESLSITSNGMNGYIHSELSDVELASLVSGVQDLFPDLGIGFIEECLKYFNNSPEDVINSLLENNLPPSLDSLDRNLPSQPKNTTENNCDKVSPVAQESEVTKESSSILDERANIYNDDEFDLLSTNNSKVDMSKIHKGKKNKHVSNGPSDNQFSTKMKEIARRYEERKGTSIYEDELVYEPQPVTNDYDDEYDDTYDDHIAVTFDPLEETLKPNKGSYPSIRGKGALNKPISEENSESEESDKEGNSNNRNGFRNNDINDQNRHNNGRYSKHSSSSRESSSRGRNSAERNYYKSNRYGNGEEEDESNKTSFKPFCENPEIIRQRAEQKRMDRERLRYGGKGGYRRGGGQQGSSHNDGRENTGDAGRSGEGGHHARYSSGKNSGKSWRQGQDNGDDDSGRRHGGKFKQEGNTHGKAQDKNFRHKMVHKNDVRRRGADYKMARNN